MTINTNCKIGKITYKQDANVVALHVVEQTRFLKENRMPTKDVDVLLGALEDSLTDVVVVGYNRKGIFECRGAHADRLHTAGLLHRGIQNVMPW